LQRTTVVIDVDKSALKVNQDELIGNADNKSLLSPNSSTVNAMKSKI